MNKKLAIILISILLLLSAAGCAVQKPAERPEPSETVQIKTHHTEAPSAEVPASAGETETPSEEPDTAESSEPVTEPESTETEAPLPEGFVWEGDELYYYAPAGVRFRGWIHTDEGYSYFDEARVEGLYTIDGQRYYFPDGIMATGWQETEDGQTYYFDEETGAARLGWIWDWEAGHKVYLSEDGLLKGGTYEVEGALYVFDEEGRCLQGMSDGYLYDMGERVRETGRVNLRGIWYLTDEEGRVLTGKQKVGGVWYYFWRGGDNAVGWVEAPDGEVYYAEKDGWLNMGFVSIDDKLYYFDPADCHMWRNATINDYVIDENGVCRNKYGEITDANLDDYVVYLLNTYGWDPYSIWKYVTENYTFKYLPWDTDRNMAIRMFNTGYGSCYDYCAITAMMLRRAGYECRMVEGESPIRGHHYWLLVEMSPGVWRHMDTMRRELPIYNLTDDELYAYNGVYDSTYKWDRSQWTSTTPTGRGE